MSRLWRRWRLQGRLHSGGLGDICMDAVTSTHLAVTSMPTVKETNNKKRRDSIRFDSSLFRNKRLTDFFRRSKIYPIPKIGRNDPNLSYRCCDVIRARQDTPNRRMTWEARNRTTVLLNVFSCNGGECPMQLFIAFLVFFWWFCMHRIQRERRQPSLFLPLPWDDEKQDNYIIMMY